MAQNSHIYYLHLPSIANCFPIVIFRLATDRPSRNFWTSLRLICYLGHCWLNNLSVLFTNYFVRITTFFQRKDKLKFVLDYTKVFWFSMHQYLRHWWIKINIIFPVESEFTNRPNELSAKPYYHSILRILKSLTRYQHQT